MSAAAEGIDNNNAGLEAASRRPGPPPGACHKGGAAAAVTLRQLCREADAQVAPLIVELRRQGHSLRAIAAELTARSIPTRYGWKVWQARQVSRILQRAAADVRQ